MSDEETTDLSGSLGEMLLVIPCGGVERKTGQLTACSALECIKNGKISNLRLEPSFPQIATNREKYASLLQRSKVIAIDGCSQKCVSKILNEIRVKPFGSFPMPQLLKAKKLQLAPGNDLSLQEAAIIPQIAQILMEQIQSLLLKKEGEETSAVPEFKPSYAKILEYRQSKFQFTVPTREVGFHFNWNDAWAYVQESHVFVGISDYLQKSIGDVTLIELPKVGSKVDQLEALASIETVKTVIDLIAPFSGKVVNVNVKLRDSPELINQSPYNSGWVCIIEASDLQGELENLMSPADYFEFMKGKVDEEAKKSK